MDSVLLPIAGVVAVIIAVIVATRLLAKPSEERPLSSPQPGPGAAASAKAERSYPVTTIGIPPGHVSPSGGPARGLSHPITTIGIPPGHVTRS